MNAIIAEVQTQIKELEIPDIGTFTMPDGVWIGIPVTISIITFAAREAIAALGKRHEKELTAELERERAEREAEQDRIKYLEEQNKMLLQRAIDLSAPPPNYHGRK